MAELTDSAGIIAEKIPILACPSCEAELDISGNTVFQAFSCPNCSAVMDTPARFGDFILLSKIGAGGMGAVFLAQDEKLGRQVAVKVNRKEFGSDPKFLERFEIEAQAMARFNHPNVVQIYTYGQEYGQPYMVTEFVTGGDLAGQMVPGQGLDQLAVLNVARDLAEGLQAAQDNGLIHGDIKPENVMFDERGNAKIMDFGLAKFGGEEDGKPKEVWGTPFYIAPEKAKKKGEDYLSDQYSLGAALYHVLAGEPPFDGKTPTDVVVARLNADAPLLHEVSPYISKKTSGIIARMMSRDPKRRYPTYASMQTDLREAIEFAEKNPGPYDFPGGQGEEAAGDGEGGKKFPLIPVLIGGGVVGLLGLIGLIVALSGDREPPPPKPPMVITPKVNNPGALPDKSRTGIDLNTIITRSKLTDDIPFTTSQQKEFVNVRTLLEKKDNSAAKTGLYRVYNGSPYDKVGRQWSLLYRGILQHYMVSAGEANKLYDELLAAKPVYTKGAPPVANPVDFANYLKGNLSEKDFEAKVAKYPKDLQKLAVFTTAIKLAGTDPKKSAARAKSYADAAPASGYDAWIHALQPLAKQISEQGTKLHTEFSKFDPKKKAENRKRVEAYLKNGSFRLWKPYLDRELKKWPKK